MWWESRRRRPPDRRHSDEGPCRTQGLRRGDLVDVRGPAEIQATLDESGGGGGVPFMPEMSLLCGKRFVVDRRAERICDTIEYTGSRRARDAVLLDDPRCDGSAHGGCQADCRTFWKECWLRKVAPDTSPPPAGDEPAIEALVRADLQAPAVHGGH